MFGKKSITLNTTDLHLLILKSTELLTIIGIKLLAVQINYVSVVKLYDTSTIILVVLIPYKIEFQHCIL